MRLRLDSSRFPAARRSRGFCGLCSFSRRGTALVRVGNSVTRNFHALYVYAATAGVCVCVCVTTVERCHEKPRDFLQLPATCSSNLGSISRNRHIRFLSIRIQLDHRQGEEEEREGCARRGRFPSESRGERSGIDSTTTLVLVSVLLRARLGGLEIGRFEPIAGPPRAAPRGGEREREMDGRGATWMSIPRAGRAGRRRRHPGLVSPLRATRRDSRKEVVQHTRGDAIVAGRVNAFLLLCRATRARQAYPARHRLGKFPSTVIQTRVQPKTRPFALPRERCARIDHSSIG